MVAVSFGAMLLVSIVVTCFHIAGQALCGNETITEAVSPDSRHRAVAFVRDCGATTPFSTQVALLRDGVDLPNDPGNLADADGKWSVELSWSPDGRLVVQYPAGVPLRFAERSVDGVAVHYEPR